jgi:hypothetical protein
MKKLSPNFFAMGVALVVTFLFPSVPAVYPQEPPPPGIYVGILSFDSDVTPLIQEERKDADNGKSNFIALNGGEDTILRALDAYNRPSPQDGPDGAALFYAVHRAIADLTNAHTKLIPKDIDSIYIVTITDSYDNASANTKTLNEDGFPGGLKTTTEQRRDEAGYSAFIKHNLLETPIPGIPLHAYSLGLGTAWRAHLESIASNPAVEYVTYGNMGAVKKKLSEITKKIKRADNQMILSAVLRPPFDGTRFRFQIDEKQPNYYIDGTVIYQDGKPTITNITSEPKTLYEPLSLQAITEGSPEGSSAYSFDFTINGDKFLDGNPGKLYHINQYGQILGIDTDAQLFVHNKTSLERKSVVVYFLLDNSKSMENNKREIRDSLIQSIRYFQGVIDNP